jgi:hypothetical protein
MKGAAFVSVYGGLVPLGLTHSCLLCRLWIFVIIAHNLAARNPFLEIRQKKLLTEYPNGAILTIEN